MIHPIPSLVAGISMFVESLSMAIANIAANKLRSFLTILGIMIGVTAVIALITTISGVSASISDSFTSMGAGSLTVSTPGSDLKPGLSSADLDDIAAMDGVQGVTPSVSLSVKGARNDVSETGLRVSGVNEFYFVNNPDALESGRSINPIDIEEMSRVCLIGSDVMETFFYGVNPIGQTIYLNATRFTVVGILAENTDSSIASILSGSQIKQLGFEIGVHSATSVAFAASRFSLRMAAYFSRCFCASASLLKALWPFKCWSRQRRTPLNSGPPMPRRTSQLRM